MKKLTTIAAGLLMAGAIAGTVGAGSASASVVYVGNYPDMRACAYAGVAQHSAYWRCDEQANGSYTLYADDGTTDRAAN